MDSDSTPNKPITAAPESQREHVFKIDNDQVANLMGCPREAALKKFWNDHDERLKIATN